MLTLEFLTNIFKVHFGVLIAKVKTRPLSDKWNWIVCFLLSSNLSSCVVVIPREKHGTQVLFATQTF